LAGSEYGKEIWRLYQAGKLTPDSELTGRIEIDHRIADVDAVLEVVKEALLDEERRQLYQAG
jgi:RIO kinase 1